VKGYKYIDFQNSVRYLGVILSHIPTSFAKHIIMSRSLNANSVHQEIDPPQHRRSYYAVLHQGGLNCKFWNCSCMAIPDTNRSLTANYGLRLVPQARMLSVHKSSKNRIIHFILAAGSFVEYLHSTFDLPYTAAFGALLQERETREAKMPAGKPGEQVLRTIPKRWPNPLQDDRHIFTRFLMQSFYFKYCSRAVFHDAKDTSVCKFCGDLCVSLT
jgi:hypothetical protein